MAGLAFVGGCAVGLGPVGPRPEPTAALRCGGPLPAVAGQKLMVRMQDEATPELIAATRAGSLGGVILFPVDPSARASVAREVARLQDAARAAGRPPLLVATDQEGGIVERFDGPPDVAPPQIGDVDAAAREGAATGEFIGEIGVTMDLAPVLDLGLPGAAVGARTFSDEPAEVARLGGAFATGLADSGVSPVLKHFPGIGRTASNTDEQPTEISASADALAADIAPFRSAIDAGAPAVMVSNAAYPALGADSAAVLERRIVTGLLRDRLGFEGVVVSDDLLAGAIGAEATPERAAVAASAAGVDVLLYAATTVEGLDATLVRAVEAGSLDEDELRESCARIAALKYLGP
ncbi:hypothetical protein HJD18_07980 [Thermoleophilia bacterium SCSIO 60948]|nr:hypothetical protein HJD18_07980 [Thermoleophilia bacterium SCSIO 60948]